MNLARIGTVLLSALLICSLVLEVDAAPHAADWVVTKTADDMTGIETVGAHAGEEVAAGFHDFGIECGRPQTGESIYFTWSVAGESFLSSSIKMIVKVDDNPPQNLLAGPYNDSHDSGYASFIGYGAGRELMPQLRAGERARIRLQSGTTTVNFSVSLKGFTKAGAEVLASCGE